MPKGKGKKKVGLETEFVAVCLPLSKFKGLLSRDIGEVFQADAAHETVFNHIVFGSGPRNMVFANPRDLHLSRKDALILAGEFGFRSATDPEVCEAVETASKVQLDELFRASGIIRGRAGIHAPVESLALVGHGSHVKSEIGDLSPVRELLRFGLGHRLHLRLFNPDHSVPPGQMLSLVYQ
jgi:hypothetical protein